MLSEKKIINMSDVSSYEDLQLVSRDEVRVLQVGRLPGSDEKVEILEISGENKELAACEFQSAYLSLLINEVQQHSMRETKAAWKKDEAYFVVRENC